MKELSDAGIPEGGKIGEGDQKLRGRSHQHYQDYQNGTGAKVLFMLPKTPRDTSQLAVYVAGLRMRPKKLAVANDFSLKANQVTFVVAPAVGVDNVCFDIVSS